MGQQQTREHGSPGSSGFHITHHGSHRGMPSSASAGALSTSLSASSLAPPPPPPLPSHLSDTVNVDQGGLVPTGVYTGPQDYDQHFVRQNIVDRRLAPFCVGSDDDDEYADEKFNCECPICFLSYPTPLNFSRCCRQPICTECFVQMKRADPTSHNPPSSEPRSCPFCVEPEFGVSYSPPEAIEKASGSSSINNEATDATNFAEMAIGTGGVNTAGGAGKYKILPVDDPNVITVDQVRPDWQYRLAQAEAAVARRANRRVIMRQVGDRLIPIGISSSRMGADLAAAAESGRINLNGPGGSIILNDGQMWPGTNTVTTSRRRSSRPSRGAEDNMPDLARMLRMGSGEDMEEIMMMEAMRLSLLEHEEQQRKQAEQEKTRQQQDTQAAAALAASDSSSTPTRKPPTATQSVLEEHEGRTVQNTYSPPPVARAPVNATSLGISQSMMDELSELVEEGAPPMSSAPSVNRNGRQPAPAPEPVPVPQPVASMGSALQEPRNSGPSSTTANESTDAAEAFTQRPPHVEFSTNTSSGANSPIIGSPSASGFTRSRIVNPNNPFRRSMGEHHS